jgi:hypothetical protein
MLTDFLFIKSEVIRYSSIFAPEFVRDVCRLSLSLSLWIHLEFRDHCAF